MIDRSTSRKGHKNFSWNRQNFFFTQKKKLWILRIETIKGTASAFQRTKPLFSDNGWRPEGWARIKRFAIVLQLSFHLKNPQNIFFSFHKNLPINQIDSRVGFPFVALNAILKELTGCRNRAWRRTKKEPTALIDWSLRPRVLDYPPICHQISDWGRVKKVLGGITLPSARLDWFSRQSRAICMSFVSKHFLVILSWIG